jgi:CheY-like chemotaxis protein
MAHRSHVLVADDDPLLLSAVADALIHLGAVVSRAESGAELIERLAGEGPFDLVVTDVAMPWMSGLQAMHSARTAGLGTPVIVMTALKDERIAAQVQALGRHAILLRKPFELSELEATATRLLSLKLSDGRSADLDQEGRSDRLPGDTR